MRRWHRLCHMAVDVEREFILEQVAQCALIERHVALEELEIQQDVKSITKGIGIGFVSRNGLVFVSGIDTDPRRVSIPRHINALVLVIFPL